MALEPITRQEQIIAGKDLEPITRMEKFLKQYGGGGGGGGSGFEYDFIIKTDGETYTLDTGTYEAINAKLGKQPLNGKIILFAGDAYKADMNCVLVINNGEQLLAHAFMGEAYISVVINADNTVTSAG